MLHPFFGIGTGTGKKYGVPEGTARGTAACDPPTRPSRKLSGQPVYALRRRAMLLSVPSCCVGTSGSSRGMHAETVCICLRTIALHTDISPQRSSRREGVLLCDHLLPLQNSGDRHSRTFFRNRCFFNKDFRAVAEKSGGKIFLSHPRQ